MSVKNVGVADGPFAGTIQVIDEEMPLNASVWLERELAGGKIIKVPYGLRATGLLHCLDRQPMTVHPGEILYHDGLGHR